MIGFEIRGLNQILDFDRKQRYGSTLSRNLFIESVANSAVVVKET